MDKKTKEKAYTFLGNVIRCVHDSVDFKIYALSVDKEKYPDIKHNKYGGVTILGELHDLTLGVEYEVTAIEQLSSKYGASYKVTHINRDIPRSEEDMYDFLSEILTDNQAKTLWSVYPDIVQRVKENRLDDIDLNKLKGIKEYTFEKIKKKIVENFCLIDLVTEFHNFLSINMIKKIYSKYPSIETLKRKLKENPYPCLCSLAGVGFKTADSILLDIEKVSKENVANNKKPVIDFEVDLKSSLQRCLSCMIYILQENESEGHTKMNLIELRKECERLVPECLHHFAEALKSDEIYYNKNTMDAALKKTYETENKIAKTVYKNWANCKNIWQYDISKYKFVDGVTLSDEQIKTLENVCKYAISILNGAAGCGKSYSTQAIINMLKDHNHSFKLFSPTGKAAKILSAYTREKASTIHRGLGYTPPDGWLFNKDNKLKCDIVIIDEFSMVDIYLFNKVIDAIDFDTTKLLLIGDNAQLPSVSCGNLLHDFIESKLIPTVTLTKVFRYGEGGLMKVATDVRSGQTYLTKSMKSKATAFGENKDYVFFDVASEDIPGKAVKLYQQLLSMGNTIENIQVLTAKNVGDCGAIALNNAIQKIANHNYGSEINMTVGGVTYYKGDLVIQKANNYDAEIDNGDVFKESIDIGIKPQTAFIANGENGIITEIYNAYMVINFDGICVKYYREDLKNIGLGYSISIHKSQGGSFDNVILCTPQSHVFMLNSNILYVGLTRMRKKCYHLGALSTINQAVKKRQNLTRHTFMQELLNNMGESSL